MRSATRASISPSASSRRRSRVDVGLCPLGLDAGDARLDRVLALVEVGVLDRPDLVARRRLLEPLDLLVFQPGARRRGGVAAQQFLARHRKSRLEGMHAVGAQEQRALGHPVEAFAIVRHDQHRHLEVDCQPALQRVDVGEVEMVGRLVQDQKIWLFQPGRRSDQHQALPAARQRAEPGCRRSPARRRSRPAARRCASPRRHGRRVPGRRPGRRAPAGPRAPRECPAAGCPGAGRASGSPGRHSTRAHRSGISAGSTCRRRSRRPVPCARHRAGTTRPRRRGSPRSRNWHSPCPARPDAAPLSFSDLGWGRADRAYPIG